MWIFNTDGFFSASINPYDKNYIQLRARRKKDIENAAKKIDSNLKIHEYSGSDYRYRIFISKQAFENYMKLSAQNIDYSNFKDAVHKKDMEKNPDKKALDEKMEAYFNVWRIMHRYQEIN
jgi:hypothetical protein